MSEQKDSAGFLDRWSTRKQQSSRRGASDGPARGAGTDTLAQPLEPADLSAGELLQSEMAGDDLLSTQATPADAATTARDTVQQSEGLAPMEAATALLTDADMPDVETLTARSDISGFFSQGVSAALRKAALRHVFRQPSYNVRDGLDDYDGDYTKFEPLGDTVTADMKFHAARKERARLESERLAQEQVETEVELPERAEAVQKHTPTHENAQAGKFVEEDVDAGREGTLGSDHERQDHAVAASGDDAGQDADGSHEQLCDQHPDTDNPLNKTSQATASPSCEIPNE